MQSDEIETPVVLVAWTVIFLAEDINTALTFAARIARVNS